MFNTRNQFVLLGCNITALITEDQEYRRGCYSFCDGPGQQVESSCSGIGCCQFSIDNQLDHLNLTIFRMNDSPLPNDKFCLNAFLTTKSAFNIAGANLSALPNYLEPSEVILDWVAGNETCQAARNCSGTYACGENTDCLDSTNGPGYRCYCKLVNWLRWRAFSIYLLYLSTPIEVNIT